MQFETALRTIIRFSETLKCVFSFHFFRDSVDSAVTRTSRDTSVKSTTSARFLSLENCSFDRALFWQIPTSSCSFARSLDPFDSMKISNTKARRVYRVSISATTKSEARSKFYEDAPSISAVPLHAKFFLRTENSRELHSFQEQRRVAISGVLNLTVEIVSTFLAVRWRRMPTFWKR